ncbi:prephenate dehydratase [Escherichia coli]|nr:prephenate dehydratase [Escherichia coli]
MAASPIPSFSDCPWVFHALLRPRELANNLHYFCFAITNRPEQVHFKAKALPNFYPQYHIASRKQPNPCFGPQSC